MPKVNVTDASGRTFAVDESLLSNLQKLDYAEESAAHQGQRLRQEAEAEHYESTGQQVVAGLEGLASGVTVGVSDLLLDDEETRARARYNPGTRIATELVGAIVPAVVSGGSGALAKVASITPTALATRAGAGAARALGRGTATALAVEGAIQGAGSAASHAVLQGDPLTVESVAAGAGFGALVGAGFGLLSRGTENLGKHAESALAKKQAEAAEAVLSRESPALLRASDNLQKVTAAAKRAVSEVEGALTPESIGARIKALAASGDQLSMEAAALKGPELVRFRSGFAEASRNLRSARSAAAAKDHEMASYFLDEYAGSLERINEKVGAGVPIPRKAIESVEAMTEASVLGRLPASPAGLAAMGDDVADDYFESLRNVLGKSGDDLDPLRAGVIEDLDSAMREVGVAAQSMTPDGVVEALKSYRVQLRESRKAIGSPGGKGHESTFLGFLRKVGGLSLARKASSVARAHGAGALGSALAYHGAGIGSGMLIAELTGLRAAATSHIEEIVSRLAPRASKALQRAAPVGERLRQSMTGEYDDDQSKDVRQLAKERVDEITRMAPVAGDVAYSAVEPLIPASPEFAMGLSRQMLTAMRHLVMSAPKDPGATNIGLKSDWMPSESEAVEFAGVYEAVMAPMDAFERVCTGDGDPATAEALWQVHPALMQEGAIRLLERLPEIQENTDFATRSSLSTAFRVPLDGLLYPQSIAALQALFVPPAPEKGAGSAPSNPPGRPAAGASTQDTRTQTLTGA